MNPVQKSYISNISKGQKIKDQLSKTLSKGTMKIQQAIQQVNDDSTNQSKIKDIRVQSREPSQSNENKVNVVKRIINNQQTKINLPLKISNIKKSEVSLFKREE